MAEGGYDPNNGEYDNQEPKSVMLEPHQCMQIAQRAKIVTQRLNALHNLCRKFEEKLNNVYAYFKEQEESQSRLKLLFLIHKSRDEVNFNIKRIVQRREEIYAIHHTALQGNVAKKECYEYVKQLKAAEEECEDIRNELRSSTEEMELAEAGYDPNRPTEAELAGLEEKIRPWIEAQAGAYDRQHVIQSEALNNQYRTVEAMIENLERRLIQVGNAMNAERVNIHMRFKGADIPPFINDMYDLYVTVDQSLQQCQNEINIVAQKIQSAEQRDKSKQSKRYRRNMMKRYAKYSQKLNAIARRVKSEDYTLSTIEENLIQLRQETPETKSEILFPKQLLGSDSSSVRQRIADSRQQRQAYEQQRDKYDKATVKIMADLFEQMEIEKRAINLMQRYRSVVKRYEKFAERLSAISNNIQKWSDTEESRQLLELIRKYEVDIANDRRLMTDRIQEIEDIGILAYQARIVRQKYNYYVKKLTAFEKQSKQITKAIRKLSEEIEQQYDQCMKNA